jgi:peptide/nickel transport system substrate-binding protein
MRRFFVLLLAIVAICAVEPRLAECLEIRIGVPKLPVVLDPATAESEVDRFLYPQIFETLVRFRDGGTDIEPGLATNWQVSRDGLTWTFQLRPNVRFHDGTILIADHVVLALERQMVVDHPLRPNPPALWTRALSGSPGIVRGVRRTDASTLIIELTQPFGPLPAVLAHPALAVVLPASGAVSATTPFIGTGPFRLAQVDPGAIILEAHPAYWGGNPRVDRVTLRETGDEAAALGDLFSGGLDLLLPAILPSGGPGGSVPVRLLSTPTGSLGVLILNTNREPLKRKKVRQALALGLDPDVIIPSFRRAADFARHFLPAGFWGASDGSFYPPVNLPRARALLAEERIREGTGLTLLVERSPGATDLGAVAQALRNAWAAIGLQLRIQVEPPDGFRMGLRAGEYDLALTEQRVPVLDPDSLFSPLASLTGAPNPTLGNLLFRAGQVSFRSERLRLYQRAQAFLADELLWFPLYHPLQWVLTRPEVREARLHPSGTVRLHALRVEALPKIEQ